MIRYIVHYNNNVILNTNSLEDAIQSIYTRSSSDIGINCTLFDNHKILVIHERLSYNLTKQQISELFYALAHVECEEEDQKNENNN